jgi:hypothetical protein
LHLDTRNHVPHHVHVHKTTFCTPATAIATSTPSRSFVIQMILLPFARCFFCNPVNRTDCQDCGGVRRTMLLNMQKDNDVTNTGSTKLTVGRYRELQAHCRLSIVVLLHRETAEIQRVSVSLSVTYWLTKWTNHASCLDISHV